MTGVAQPFEHNRLGISHNNARLRQPLQGIPAMSRLTGTHGVCDDKDLSALLLKIKRRLQYTNVRLHATENKLTASALINGPLKAIGAGAGAAVGAVAGNTAVGAIVGTAAGTAGGYLYDRHKKSEEKANKEAYNEGYKAGQKKKSE